MDAGMDPYLGVLHAATYGRPSLVLDLMEEFRPVVVDALVLRLINRRQLTSTDFGPPELDDEAEDIALGPPGGDEASISAVSEAASGGGIYLRAGGRKVFVGAFYGRLRERILYPPADMVLDLKQIIRHQVYQLARRLKGEVDEYVPFVPR